MSQGSYSNDGQSFRELWRENHGNFLLAFAGTILVIGGIVMLWPEGEKKTVGLVSVIDDSEQVAEQDALREERATDSADQDVLLAEQTLLRVRVIGLGKDDGGEVRIAVYTDPSTFNQPTATTLKTAIPVSDDVQWDVKVPTGMLVAISVYHDANANGKLDRNLIGIPSEKYGFSQGARSQTGPPPFADAAFIPDAGAIEVPIEIW